MKKLLPLVIILGLIFNNSFSQNNSQFKWTLYKGYKIFSKTDISSNLSYGLKSKIDTIIPCIFDSYEKINSNLIKFKIGSLCGIYQITTNKWLFPFGYENLKVGRTSDMYYIISLKVYGGFAVHFLEKEGSTYKISKKIPINVISNSFTFPNDLPAWKASEFELIEYIQPHRGKAYCIGFSKKNDVIMSTNTGKVFFSGKIKKMANLYTDMYGKEYHDGTRIIYTKDKKVLIAGNWGANFLPNGIDDVKNLSFNGDFIVKKAGYYGVYSEDYKKIIIPIEYDDVFFSHEGYLCIKKEEFILYKYSDIEKWFPN